MLRTITPATEEPVSLDEAKAHLRVTHSHDDDLITSLITASREVVESATGVALAEAEYIWAPERSGSYAWRPALPLWPATVDEVTHYDGDARVAIEVDDYRFDALRGVLTIGQHAEPEVAFTTVPDAVPAALKAAMLLLVADLYEHRGGVIAGGIESNPAAARLIWPYRRNLGV